MPMMDMCRRMMSPIVVSGDVDSKATGQMLEMRGELMKAMGEIMMKHARRMQGATSN